MLAGKIALVTGGGSGIGRAVCSLFAKEGARIIVADIDEKAALNTMERLSGVMPMQLAADIGTARNVQRMQTCCQHSSTQQHSHLINGQQSSVLVLHP